MENANSPSDPALKPRPSVERWTRNLLIVAACVAGYFILTNNALLGTWSAPGDVDLFPPKTGAPPTTMKGIKFFRSRKFTTFGMNANGGSANPYGTYHFWKSNLVSLDIKGFHVTLTNRDVDIPIKGSFFAPLMEPQIWRISEDGKSLEEVGYSGDGTAQRLYKE
jgi:hypothetical protein